MATARSRPKSGAADTLAALGVKIDLGPEAVGRCIRDAGIGFMFAPMHHAAMKHVGPARAELGFRTVFNLVGPLSNPAGVKRYLLGVFSPDWVEPVARVLADLGADAAWVVHGSGGLDELSPAGESKVAMLKDGKITVVTVTPEEAGLKRAPLAAIKGGDAKHNAEALAAVLRGAPGAYRDTVLLNAAAALVVADTGATQGVRLAALDRRRQGARRRSGRGVEWEHRWRPRSSTRAAPPSASSAWSKSPTREADSARLPECRRSQQASGNRRREGARPRGGDGNPGAVDAARARVYGGDRAKPCRRPAGR